jgi:Cellulase (glycosyl hydrolase family 5)/Domain of unknown function (DUF5060)
MRMHSIPRRLGVFALLLWLGSVSGAAELGLTRRTAGPVRAWEVAEWRVDLDKTYANPFDPDQIAVDAVISSPKGVSSRVPAFWYQEQSVAAQGEGKPPKVTGGESFWMLRWCPVEAGEWSVYLEAKDAAGTRKSAIAHFTTVAGSNDRGFVRTAANRRYFAFDSGDPYFIVGVNTAWGKWGLWADEFDRWFTKLAQNGGNFARVWTTEQRWKLEYPDTGLNCYDLASAAYYDEVLASAQRHGIYVMLCFTNHRDLLEKDMWGAAPWPTSPYNAAKGGPATRPADFFTNPAARAAYKKRLRYAVARYGAYTSLGFWELFNEQEIAGLGGQAPWNAEMSSYIASIDPYHHLITTSSQGLPAEVWKLPTIGCTQAHYYGDDTTVDLVTPATDACRTVQTFGKPQILTEFGISYKRSDEALDRKSAATALHNSLWTGMMAGAAGGACHWWWDSYVDPKGLWGTYKPFAGFAQQIDWAHSDLRPMGPLAVERAGDLPQTLGDAVLTCTVDWKRSHGQPITLLPNGKTDRPLPQFLFSINKPELRTPTILKVDLAQESEMVLHAVALCDFAMIRVSIDGRPARDFGFSALPGAEEIESTRPLGEGGPYMAQINSTRRVKIPAGQHAITLDNVTGDWVKLGSVTFTHATSPRYAHMAAAGLQDAGTSQTLLWVLDERSNWKNDQEDKAPETLSTLVTVPVKKPGQYNVTWWDTRKGEVVQSSTVQAEGLVLKLTSPAFTRDIAVKVLPAGAAGN